MGQFMTPRLLAQKVIGNDIKKEENILEPSFGDGSFIIEIAKKLMPIYDYNLDNVFDHIYGIELDPILYNKCLLNIKKEFGKIPEKHHLINEDFLLHNFDGIFFKHILGNPPFGGTIPIKYQNKLEELYGKRYGKTIKRESYSYFLVKSVGMLEVEGKLSFICSDTFLTIKTMCGLRNFLMQEGLVSIKELPEFSEETNYGMVIIDFIKSNKKESNYIEVFGQKIFKKDMEKIGNLSWGNVNEYMKYFIGPHLSTYIICSSGMTIGKNEYFVREIVDDKIIEPYNFTFYNKPITLKDELNRAHFNKLSESQKVKITHKEQMGETKKDVKIEPLTVPESIMIPNDYYKYYNKMVPGDVYVEPKYVIYWRNDGEAVKMFKKNGNWYLHGIGGLPFFGREGITWNLIGSKINPRYLPKGYILDSGCPCGFLKNGVEKDELFFIMGWLLTSMANDILKNVINHTRNIQGKDVEKLPYPIWVSDSTKHKIIDYVKSIIDLKKNGTPLENSYVEVLTELFDFQIEKSGVD